MLALTRKPGEKIHVEGGITITIFRCPGGSVRLGIEAPRDKRIWRGELGDSDAETQRPLVADAATDA